MSEFLGEELTAGQVATIIGDTAAAQGGTVAKWCNAGRGKGADVREVAAGVGGAAVESGSSDVVVVFASDEAVLATALDGLKPNGKVICVVGSSADEVLMALTLAGFVDLSVVNVDETNLETVQCTVCGSKPTWEVGASAQLAAPSNTAALKWSIMATNDLADGGADEDDLMDEDDLLAAGGEVKKTEDMDCGTAGPGGKRRACKDCSCGLAEMLESDAKAQAPPTSSCGGCYKGDAFRCASCPFLGKPAFEKGQEKVVLQLSDDL